MILPSDTQILAAILKKLRIHSIELTKEELERAPGFKKSEKEDAVIIMLH